MVRSYYSLELRAVDLHSKLTNATRKIAMYMLSMIVQNLSDFGWKFFSASAYSSMTGSATDLGAWSSEAVEDISRRRDLCEQVTLSFYYIYISCIFRIHLEV